MGTGAENTRIHNLSYSNSVLLFHDHSRLWVQLCFGVYSSCFMYIFTKLVVLGCISSYCLLRQRREVINKDDEMIRIIKRELMRLNENELI